MAPNKAKSAKEKFDIYETVTNKIIERLEQGEIPWQRPWNPSVGKPRNLITDKTYNGVNAFILGSQRYDNPYWLSFKQCQDKSGTVKKGEKGSMIVYWSFLDKTTGRPIDRNADHDGDPIGTNNLTPILRYYTVFNANQCENLPTPIIEAPKVVHGPIESAAKIITDMKNAPDILHGFVRACFDPSQDIIKMPNLNKFSTPEHYYGTLFHELTHSTGHTSRLNRPFGANFGDERYSKEELIAEMGAAFLCAKTGIENKSLDDNSAAYIQSWLKALKDDKKLIITAAGQAQKAVNHITGNLEQTVEKIEEVKTETIHPIIAKEIKKTLDDRRADFSENQFDALYRLIHGPDPKIALAKKLEDAWLSGNKVPESDYKYYSIGNFALESIIKGNADVKSKQKGMTM